MRLRSLPLCILLITTAVSFVWSEPLVHTVAKGETLYAIARMYKVSVDAILKANGISDVLKVFVGTKLIIPSSYTAQKGDTFYGVARTYGISVKDLLAMNGLKEGAALHVGDSLIVPSRGESSVTPAVSKAPPTNGTKSVVSGVVTTLPAKKGAWPATGEVVYLRGKLFGVSIRTAKSAPIVAVRSGTVKSAGPFRGFSLVAFIQAKDGLVYVYGGADALSVQVGDQVEPGTIVGLTGLDLVVGDPIAYFFVFKDGDAIDPGKVPRE